MPEVVAPILELWTWSLRRAVALKGRRSVSQSLLPEGLRTPEATRRTSRSSRSRARALPWPQGGGEHSMVFIELKPASTSAGMTLQRQMADNDICHAAAEDLNGRTIATWTPLPR